MHGTEISFREAVRRVVQSIPRGEVSSYAEVARQAGYPGAARAVGTLMRRNTDASVPCHRVIQKNGRVGAYNRGGEDAKAKRLLAEGVRLEKRNVIRGGHKWYSV